MDPFSFESSYHIVPLVDMRMGLIGLADIRRYMAGWPTKKQLEKGAIDTFTEYQSVMTALARKLGVKGVGLIPKKFHIKNDSRVDPSEEFYPMTIRRAFEGRGSPSEMYDTARIAFLVGRIKFPVDATGYAAKYFAQDCNSFVSNYLGISPYISISGFAHGFPGHGPIPNATTDIYTCRGLLPLPPVPDIDSIGEGTVLITYGDPDGNNNRWRHIALVQGFTPIMSTGGARRSGTLSIVEWGKPGDTSAHYVPPTKVDLIHYKNPELPGKTFLAFKSKDSIYGKDAVRMFFDSSQMTSFPHRGWHVCNPQGGLVYDG